MGNFSRLFIDPSKPLSDVHLIRTTYRAPDNTIPVSFNAQGYRLYERLETFYLEYHKLLRESLDFLESTCILNIHSHDPELSPSVDADVILYHPDGGNSKLI
jgi:predicted N-formylglutamate amidohydrolase